MQKICTVCKVEKDENDFGWRKQPHKRHAACRDCARKRDNEHYANNHQRRVAVRQQSKINTTRNRQWLYDFLLTHPCVTCGETRIPCLQFHHVSPNEKDYAPSQMRMFALERIQEEVAKCIVLCANCHAVITAEQFNWYKDLRPVVANEVIASA